MIKKLKIMTIVGTRPEIIRLSRVIQELENNSDHILVHTGQNYDYELNEIFFNDLSLSKPNYFLNAAGESGAETIGKVIIESHKILLKEKPDAVLILGDTNSCMSVLSAKRLKIPTFHMEAGNRCFDMRVPEEINRRMVDHIADVNLTYSSIARDYLLKEGLPPDMIIKTGSPMKEVLDFYSNDIDKSNILKELNLEPGKYFVISSHREENIDDENNFSKFVKILNELDKKYKLPIIVSTHPRTRKKIDHNNIMFSNNVHLIKPLGFFDYNKLQLCSKLVLSDSGTINEESSILNFRALNIRNCHERPEAMEEASVIMVGYDIERIIQSIEILENQPTGVNRILNEVLDYQSSNVSHKIIRIIHSYTNYINSKVWKK